MASTFNTQHSASWSVVLLPLLLGAILPHQSHAILTNSSRSGGGKPKLVPARCLPEQAAALLQLKRSFSFIKLSRCPEFSANTTLSSWRGGTDCCSWEGVECDHVAGSVTGLDLSSRLLGISGGLHPAIFNLTSLKHLNLDENQFCGSHLPSSGFQRLTHLEDLSISDCDISGPIPPSFSGLQSLKTINLGYNNFAVGSIFPPWITHLKQLKVLDFRSMSLSGPIPSSIGNLSSLTELYLSENDFSGVLPLALSNLTYLSKLKCSNCGLSGRVPSLGNLSQLEFIDLSDNNLQGPIPLGDGNILPNLQKVYLSHNSFTGTIRASIFTKPGLQYLELSSNYLSGHIEEFRNPSATLMYIDLSNNKLSGTVPTSFSQLRALTALWLNNNNFGMLDLYPYLILRSFTSFSASNNPMLSVSGDYRNTSTNNSSIIDTLDLASCGLTRLPSVIKYLPKLANLDLSNNCIRGNIPDWIWRNMSFLYLQHNLFTNVGQLPAYTNIYAMDLSFNKLGGPVPFPLEGKNLDYSNNKFSSIAPFDFRRQFGVTRSIILANNELSGPIPYAECHQDDVLEVLDLSGNNLSGSVPPYLLKGCGNGLAVLNLRGNHLSGSWPDEMEKSCYLQVIDLHGNQIQGRLPRSLANCNNLGDLDVGGNNFVDIFPSWLGNLPNLQLMILRANKFYGPLSIPVEKNHSLVAGYFNGLQIIDLAENGFNGVLPCELFDVFKSMAWPAVDNSSALWVASGNTYMSQGNTIYSAQTEIAMKQQYLSVLQVPVDLKVIDLSNNRFTGSIPNTIGNLLALHVLNMSHNALSGNIPDELGHLSNVESLDLSWNRLTGSIPQALASLTNLEVLNLSYNDLSGNIPSGSQFSTFPASSFQGGNQGLYGCPLLVRCNLTQPRSSPGTPSPRGAAPAADHKFETVILCLFVGSGYGVGIAVAVVLQMACCGRRMKKALEKIGKCLVRRR